MHIPIAPVALLAAFALAATATALPLAEDILPTHQDSASTAPLFNETTTLPYVFTLDAFLFSNPLVFIPFGFSRTTVNSLGLLGRRSNFVLKDGKLIIRSNEKDLDLEVGAPALRQGVVLLPKGEGVPVRAVVEEFEGVGVKETVIEVDDEKVLADFAVARGFVLGGPLALADRKDFVNPGLVKFRVIPVY